MEQPAKRILIIAGPNGVGLNPLQPERAAIQAGRMMLEMIDACVRRGENFAFETTLSGGATPG